ncbi:MAG: monovalent cation/H+ antiporter complex subunit F [Gaiellaceae bacterium]
MNVFLWAATALLVLELPLLLLCALGSRLDGLVALQAAGGLWTIALMLLAQGFHRTVYTVLAVVAALLTFGGGLVFVRFFERELDP